MSQTIPISDVAIWFKHVSSPELKDRLKSLRDDEVINLEIDGIVGRWVRMKTGKDGRATDAIRPDGNMKEIWGDWYKLRRGELISIREVRLADTRKSESSVLFPEWDSPEDEAAFRDL